MFKYQETFAQDLTESWLKGERSSVRMKLRNCKNKAQASYISAAIAEKLTKEELRDYLAFIHPNNK